MRFLALFALVFALWGSLPAVHADAVRGHDTCLARERLAAYLAEQYAETPRAMGLVSDAGVMEVFVSSAGSWTIVVTSAEGLACVLAAGDNWEALRPTLLSRGPAA